MDGFPSTHMSGNNRYFLMPEIGSKYGSYPPPSRPVEPLQADQCKIAMKQQPTTGLAIIKDKEKTRKVIDPPPIIELKVLEAHDPNGFFTQNPKLFAIASLLKHDRDESYDEKGDASLMGTLVSSLHRLKNAKNQDCGYFLFGDISIRIAGPFRLRFTAFELQRDNGTVQYLGHVDSAVFNVVTAKDFKGMQPSTSLTRAFSEQGARLRMRKEAKGQMSKKRGKPDDDESAEPVEPQQTKTPLSAAYEPATQAKRFKANLDDNSFAKSPLDLDARFAALHQPSGPIYSAASYNTHPQVQHVQRPMESMNFDNYVGPSWSQALPNNWSNRTNMTQSTYNNEQGFQSVGLPGAYQPMLPRSQPQPLTQQYQQVVPQSAGILPSIDGDFTPMNSYPGLHYPYGAP